MPAYALDKVKASCSAIAKKQSSDVIIFNGPTRRPVADELLDKVAKRKRRDNVLLVLVTQGGSAESAYRIARCLQEAYKHFTVLIPGWCKSAGTLCVLGANEIVMTDCSELGPLDVQLPKRDEIGESSSGLVLMEALRTLRDQTFSLFEEYMLQIKEHSSGLVSFKMATEIATKMAVGLAEPLFRQIDPIQVGDTARSMAIAEAYGKRLQIKSENFDDEALQLLIDSYPDHSFVIDRREAKQIFRRVRAPNANELAMVSALGRDVRYPKKDAATTEYLTPEIERNAHETRERGKGRKGATSKRLAGKPRDAGNTRRAKAAGRVTPQDANQDRLRIVARKGG